MPYHHHIHNNLIEKCKAGNAQAQYQVYQLYAKAMYNVCYRMMNNREDAEDMLQESFTEAFMHLNSFRFETAFGAWLKRITINKCINAINKKRPDIFFTDQLPDPSPESVDTTTEENMTGLSVVKIQQALEMLPDGYRIIFSLYLLEGYDHSEISQIMGISKATSKSQYSRAKQRIKDIIKYQGHGRQI